MAYVATLNSGKLSDLCPLVEPDAQSLCRQALLGAPATTGTKFSDAALGYVAIDGDEALVGLTGTYCDPNATPACTTNTNAAAIFDSDRSFSALFSAALTAASPSNTSSAYSLAPCIEVNSQWYLDVPPSDF